MGWYQVERLLGGYPGLECPSIGAREDIGGAGIDQTCCQTPWISQEGAWKKVILRINKVNFLGSTRTCWSVESQGGFVSAIRLGFVFHRGLKDALGGYFASSRPVWAFATCKYLVVKSCSTVFVTNIFFWAFSFEQGSSHGVIRGQGYFF